MIDALGAIKTTFGVFVRWLVYLERESDDESWKKKFFARNVRCFYSGSRENSSFFGNSLRQFQFSKILLGVSDESEQQSTDFSPWFVLFYLKHLVEH